MKSFNIFIAATILSISLGVFFSLRNSKSYLTHYYIFDINNPEGERCVLIEEEIPCQPGPTDLDCVVEGYRLYETVSPIDPDKCMFPLYRAE